MREATKEERESINNYIKSISQKVITIPDGATNGDVIKALFPNAEIIRGQIKGENVDRIHLRNNGLLMASFYEDWWNAPYQEGDK